MAPEETMTTLWPSLRSFTAVSTITLSVDRRGSCVFSWTIELVPLVEMSENIHATDLQYRPSFITIVRLLMAI